MDYNCNELYHHGVKGMKWGVRRYQNKDGSLTDAGRRKVSKAYAKESAKFKKEQTKRANALYVKAYNKTADEYNNGKIAEFNKTHNSKSSTYMSDYEKQFGRDLQKNIDKMYLSDINKNKHYNKAQKICEQYGMLKFDKLAQEDHKYMSDLMKDADYE